MEQHRTNHGQDERQVNFAHPPIDLAAKLGTALGGPDIKMNLALREFFVRARVTFAAGLNQVVFMNRRCRIIGRQDSVITVTASAIRGQSRTVLGGQAMITLEKGPDAVRRQVILGIEPLRRMAFAADLL